MTVKDLITRDTNIIHVCGGRKDAITIAKKTGVNKDICECWDSWYFIDGKWNFYKDFYSLMHNPEEIRFLNELIGELLANYLQIDSVHYKIAERNGSIGLLSENFIKDSQQYFFMDDLRLLSNFNNDSNLTKIYKHCKDDKNYRELVSEIMKLVAIDLYMNQQDRNITNIQFTKIDGNLHLTPLYDFEEAVMSPYDEEYSSAFMGFNIMELYKYPELQKFIGDLYKINIGHILEQIEDEKKILIPKDVKQTYTNFVSERRKALHM